MLIPYLVNNKVGGFRLKQIVQDNVSQYVDGSDKAKHSKFLNSNFGGTGRAKHLGEVNMTK